MSWYLKYINLQVIVGYNPLLFIIIIERIKLLKLNLEKKCSNGSKTIL